MFDIVIIGAGPAGMAAAEQCAIAGLSTLVVDEQARAGGQIFRQPPASFKVSSWLPDSVYKQGKALLQRVENDSRITWQFRTCVQGLFPQDEHDSENNTWRVVLEQEGHIHEQHARRVLLCTGCYDMPVPFSGWNLPGVMSAGAIQAFVKGQQLLPGERILLAGTHPLQLVVADQILKQGGQVAGVFFAQSWTAAFAALKDPITVLRHAGKFLFMVRTFLRVRCKGVPIGFGKSIRSAQGSSKLESVEIGACDSDSNVQTFDVDRLGFCFSFLVSSELARQAGAKVQWAGDAGGWIVEHDYWQESSVSGLFVAGETTGVAGADSAMEEGSLAALGMLRSLGDLSDQQAARRASPIRHRLRSLSRFAALLRRLADPRPWLDRVTSDQANLCKCEGITVEEVKRVIHENSTIASANAVKLLSRVGMGLCQGRYCNYLLTHQLSQAKQLNEEEIGPFRGQFPAKPISIMTLLNSDQKSS